MSATVLLSRSTSFDQDPYRPTMPAVTLPHSCRAAALQRAPPPAAAGALLPASASGLSPASQAEWARPGAAQPAAPSGAAALWGRPPAPQAAAAADLPGPPAPLPAISTLPSAESEARALADRLEDLLVFTRGPHHGPEDPQLLVHSPPAEALRARPAGSSALAPASGAADAVTPQADAAAAPVPGAPAALSPLSAEGPSLAELLRGPRPLRDIALEVTRSPAIQPAYSQELPPTVLALLDDEVAAPAPTQQAAPGPRPVAASPAVPPPTVVAAPPAPALCLLPRAASCAPPSTLQHPLSPTSATGAVSPSKSGAMIQLHDLHKGEWHRAPSSSTATTGSLTPASSGDTTSSADTREGSIDSAHRVAGFAAAGAGPAPMQLGEAEEEQDAAYWVSNYDAVMTAEGVRRVMGAAVGALLPAVAMALPTLDALPDSLGGDDCCTMVDVPIHPASALAGAPAFAAMPQAAGPLVGATPPAALATPFAAAGAGAFHRPPGPPGALASPAFARFLEMVRSGSCEFEADGRVLRLRRYLRADVGPAVMDAVLDALAANTRVEALYIQNFECGMGDAQLERLAGVLRRGRIWALNVGENFRISRQAWERFCEALPSTAVGYLYVSEAHLEGTDLKDRMRDAIRQNRRVAPQRDPQVIVHVGNMWWNPRLPAALVLPLGEPGDNSNCGGSGGGLPGLQVGSKRASSDLEDTLDAAVVSSSPLLRRATTNRGFRVGFRGSLVPGASRATLLRPRPPPPRMHALPGALAGGASGALAAPGSDGVPAAMLTRSRTGGAPAADAPASALLPGRATAAAEAGLDTDDEDYRVEDDYAPEDDELLDEELELLGRGRRRHGGAAAPARASRRLQARGSGHPRAAHVPLSDQFMALAGSTASPARRSHHTPAPKRLRSDGSHDSSSAADVAGQEADASSYAAVYVPAPARRPGGGRAARGGGARRSGGGGGGQRAQRPDLKGKPSFSELVESGFMRPGAYTFTVGTQEVAAVIEDDGAIRYGPHRYRAISKFALVVLRERNPSRQSCDGWKEVAWNGEKLDLLRLRLQQYVRQQARRAPAST